MSEKCGEYDEAMTYLIWVCCAPRKGKLDFTVPRLVVFLFNDLLPFDASGPLMGHELIPSFPIYLSDVLLLFFYANYNTLGINEGGLGGVPEVVKDGSVLCQ